ncbi:MAG: flagellar biosynthetic protein FliO [Desulfitobacteriaceae bacterium]
MPNIEEQPYVPSLAGTNGGSSSFPWGGLVGTLLVFLLILFVTLWVIRRLNRSTMRGMNAPWARVLDRQVLGGQQILYLVEIAGRLQVLGGSDHYLVKLSEIDNPDVAAEILDEIANTSTEKIEGFIARFLQKIFQHKRKRQDAFSTELERLLKEVEK